MERIKRYFQNLSIIDLINLGFLGILFIILILAFNKTPYRYNLSFFYSGLLAFLFLLSRLRGPEQNESWRIFIMFIYPVIFLFSIFESFFMLLPYFNSGRYDQIMANIDFSLLGVNPTVWIEQLVHPLLTEILYILYFFYFPMPLIVLGWMYKNGYFREIERSLFIFFICYFGAYISYFLIPVQGPRYFLADLQTVGLNGYILSEPIRNLINYMEPNKLDAFPSLHAAILLITMIVARRNNKKMYNFFIPVAVGITVSLVYLRYHYIIDVIVGFVWAVFVWLAGGKVYDKYKTNFNFHFWNTKI